MIKDAGADSLSPVDLTDLDWRAFLSMIGYHRIIGFIYPLIRDLSDHIPHEYFKVLSNTYYTATAFNLRAENIFLSFTSVFNKYDIPFIPLKGMALLMDIYRSSPNRQMCDLDILIKEEDYSKVKLHLAQMNYTNHMSYDEEQYCHQHQMHVHFYQGEQPSSSDCLLEVHWRLDYRKKYAVLPDLWKRVRSEHCNDVNVMMLSPEDTLFSIALHQRRPGSLLQLKYAVDVGRLFHHYDNKIDINYILKEAQRSKLNAALYALLAQAAPFCDHKIMLFLMDKLRVGAIKRWLINAFMKLFQFTPSLLRSNNYLFTVFHFTVFHCLLYDSWLEPLVFIYFIPYPQFCIFYVLAPNDRSSRIKYEIRHFYGMYRFIKSTFFGRDNTPHRH
jgi:hypothetical protein